MSYTARIAANGKVTTSMGISRVLQDVLKSGDIVALSDKRVHGLHRGL